VKESNQILERLLARFQITGLTVTNLFKGGPYLNLVSTSAYFQVRLTLASASRHTALTLEVAVDGVTWGM
jgi:hypothetical protein